MYVQLPTAQQGRGAFFANVEERYSVLADRAWEITTVLADLAVEEDRIRQLDADLLPSGARKPQRLENLEAVFAMAAPAEHNGKNMTVELRSAWVTAKLADSREYAEYQTDLDAATSRLNDVSERRSLLSAELRLILVHMSHLDAWVGFFASHSARPPAAPIQPVESLESEQ